MPGARKRPHCLRPLLGRALAALVVGALLLSPARADAVGSTTADVVDRLVTSLATPLGELAPDGQGAVSLGVSVVVQLDGWPDRSHKLVDLVDGQLLDRLSRSAEPATLRVVRLSPPAREGALADARAAAAVVGAQWVLRVVVSVQSGYLVLEGELYRGYRGFWERAAGVDTGMRASGFARARVDAELRTLLSGRAPAPARLSPRLEAFRPGGHPVGLPREPLAVTVTDLDGDGFSDIAVLTRHAVVVWLGEGRATATAPLDALPRATYPSRSPRGWLLALPEGGQGPARLLVASTDIRGAHLFTLDGESLRRVAGATGLDGVPLTRSEAEGAQAVVVGATRTGEGTFEAPLALWEPGLTTRPLGSERAGGFAALTRAVIKRPEIGSAETFQAVLDMGERLEVSSLSSLSGARFLLGVRGLAHLVVDLDDDGRPEALVTSSDVGEGLDALAVLRLEAGGTARSVWEHRSRPVRGLAAGDVDGDGDVEVVVLVETARSGASLGLLEPGAERTVAAGWPR